MAINSAVGDAQLLNHGKICSESWALRSESVGAAYVVAHGLGNIVDARKSAKTFVHSPNWRQCPLLLRKSGKF
jgi:hypothetical protein